MSKIKQKLKKTHKAIIDSIRIIFKDPFPFHEEDKGSETDNHEKRKEN